VRPPISKIPRTKWTAGVAQEVECLLCKCEALSSKPKTKNIKHEEISKLIEKSEGPETHFVFTNQIQNNILHTLRR
jgi:hypothetical protein